MELELGHVCLDYCVAENDNGSLNVFGCVSFSARKQRRAQVTNDYNYLLGLVCNTVTDVIVMALMILYQTDKVLRVMQMAGIDSRHIPVRLSPARRNRTRRQFSAFIDGHALQGTRRCIQL